ncbi:Ig-like domain-containing protein [Ekhidna sp.]|uniref:Ig-like domain-containing protein n=1 Tax=Ekhidna sp. TaxID=2608089 RepID=UPI003CCBB4D1
MRCYNYLIKLFIASAILFASHLVSAQPDTTEIFEMEYFFDVDPGFGSATPITISTPDSTISLVELLSTSGLQTGFHILGVRARNVANNPKYNVLDTGTQIVRPFLFIDPSLRAAGQWGITETRLVFVDQSDVGSIVEIDQIEYFFDIDPGVGNASLVTPFTQGNMISISSETLNTDTLSFGFHTLGMRARAVGGAWGTTETRLIFVDQTQGVINVDQIEYFFDEDPGVGSATQITGIPAANSISLTEGLNTNGLLPGFHVLGMRVRSENGTWGTTETRMVFVDQGGTISDVTEFEYFIGTDPGVGNAANLVAASPGQMVDEEVILNTDTLGIGNYHIHFRARNADGDWGLTESRPFQVVNMAAPVITSADSIPTNTTPLNMTVSFGEAVNGFDQTDITISTGGSLQGGSFTTVNDSTFTFLLDLTTEGLITVDIADSAATAQDDGTPSPTAETFKVIYDITAPVVTVDTLFTIDTSPALTGTVDSDSVTVEITVDGSTYNASSVSVGIWTLNAGTIAALRNGVYDVVVQATDSASNVGTDTTTNELTIDILEVTIDTLSTSDTSPELTGMVTDTAATVDVTVDGTTYAATVNSDNTWTLAAGTITPPLAEGTYDVAASADRGVEGVVNDFTTNELTIFSINVLTSVDPLATNNRSPALTGTISNPTATVDVTVDGSTYSAINNGDSTWTLAAGTITPDLLDGVYDVAVLADVGGTQGADSTTNELRIDGTAPVITVDFLATSISSPELSGTIDDTDATIDVSVDGSNYTAINNGDNTWTLAAATISPGLVDSTYSVIATATDSLSNLGTDATDDELIITSTLLAVSATAITSNSFIARWSQGEDVLNYELDVSSTNDFSTFLSGFESFETTSTSAVISGLDFATSYYYRVRLVNTASETSANSNTVSVKTSIDQETIADSTALVQIYEALEGSNWVDPVNWESERLRDWDGITLDGSRLRVSQVDISGREVIGAMPNPFTGDAIGGLDAITFMNISDNEITGLMDFGTTTISDLDVSSNSLTFEDLEPLIGISSLTYSPQSSLTFNQDTGGDPIEVPHLNDTTIAITTGGSNNAYVFYRNGSAITQGSDFTIADSALTILSIDYDNMGEFSAEVTNSQLPDLTIQVDPQIVYAVADLGMTIVDGSGALLNDPISGYLMEAVRRQQGFDTLERADNVASTFTFQDVVLGDYLCGIDPSNTELFIATYFGDEFEWTVADTLEFRAEASVQVQMTEQPQELGPQDGDGVLDVLIEEDFPEEDARIDARRRAAKRKCGLRKRRRGGRLGQEDDEFELIAYGETDENGEFKFGFLPEGTYRFFVEYPGIPLDESAEIEFVVGEQGISDTEFKLEAFVDEDGIEVAIERVLGLILSYFKDLEVYPNPTKDIVRVRYRHLKAKNVSAQLIDMSGQIMWSSEVQSGFDGSLEINMSEYSKGVYVLHLYDESDPEGTVVSYRILLDK